MHKSSLVILLAFVFSYSAAQTCPIPEDFSSKASKLYEKAIDPKKKLSVDDRIELLNESIEIQADFGEEFGRAYEALSKQLFKLARRDPSFISECRTNTQTWLSICEGSTSSNDAFIAEGHYMLGVLEFLSGNAEIAVIELESFIQATELDMNPSTKRKRREATSLLPEAKFEVQFYANKDAYIPKPLPLISLPEDEYLPALSPDGSILFFTRAINKKSRGDVITQRVEEFTMSKRSSNDVDFSSGEALDYPFNIGNNCGGVSLSIDNRLLIVATSNPVPGNPQNIDLFSTTYIVDGMDDDGEFFYYWDDLELLGPEINTPQGWESQPALSSDGKELFFASARKNSTLDSDGNPTMDIYVSKRDENGNFALATTLPYPISSGAQEKAPFLHPDGKTLYFSSNRTPSGGGYDIWMTKRDSLGVWDEPVNLGTPVNTTGDEHGLVVSASGTEAFFASRRRGTQGLDILSFPVPESLRPEEIKVIHGVVDPTPPTDDVRITIEYVQSKQVEEISLNRDDGSFAAIIHTARGEDVILHVEGDDLAFEAKVLHIVDKSDKEEDKTSNYTTPTITLRAQKISKTGTFELEDVQFETNRSGLTKITTLILKEFADYLVEHSELTILIEGHTDNVGRAQDNLLLSRTRAEVVSRFLESKGVNPSRLSSKGFGEEKPKSENNSPEGRAINRRTEFTVK